MKSTGASLEAARVRPVAAAEAERLAARGGTRVPVLVTGAGGFLGVHVCRELCRRGWTVRALAHSPAKAARRLAGLPLDIVVGDLRDLHVARRVVTGMGAVVHLAAIAIERGQSYEEVNAHATTMLVAEARAARVERLVHLSQNGASSDSPHRFLQSKGMGEDAVRASALRWTVLRPSVIFGREDEFVNVLARLVRLAPLVYPLPGGGRARFQPVAVDDVARAVAAALDAPATIGQGYDLGGPEALTLREMVRRVLLAMRVRRWLVGVPVPLIRPLVALAQRLLPNPPVTTSLLALLELDNTVRGAALADVFAVTPTPFTPERLGYLREISLRGALRSLLER